jgi:hypothetical protein
MILQKAAPNQTYPEDMFFWSDSSVFATIAFASFFPFDFL